MNKKVISVRIESEGDFIDYLVRSSHGEFSIKTSGHVIEFVADSDDLESVAHLSSITRFNIVEYLQTYPEEEFLDEFDILDLGYWYFEKDEHGELHQKYTPPDYVFRRDIVQAYKKKEG